MNNERKNKVNKTDNCVASTFITQPISQADERQKRTDIALPNLENVERNKKWVEKNEK